MVPLARAVDVIRDLGARHIVISSDFGQASNPPPAEGLRAFLTALLAAGIPPADLDLMVRRNPAAILGLEP
jgi:microsomal dipeptidase-like Zn-dependent dipeptidase